MVIFYVRQKQMESNNKKIAILGNGSWATALVFAISENYRFSLPDQESRLFWWMRKEDDIKYIQSYYHNPRYLKDTELCLNNIALSSDLQYVVDQSDIVIIAFPSQYIPETLQGIDFKDKIVVNASKGMTSNPPLFVSEHLERCGVDRKHYAIISGPSHAEEVIKNKQTFLTIASEDLETACTIRLAFASPCIDNISFRMSTDVKGIELAGVIKNVYAIGMGIIANEGENLKATYLANCAYEMNTLLEILYPNKNRCIFTSPYLGDLMVTGYSSLSRNYRFGELLHAGKTIIEAKKDIGQEVAGLKSTKNIMERLDMNTSIESKHYPILSLIFDIVSESYYNCINFTTALKDIIS